MNGIREKHHLQRMKVEDIRTADWNPRALIPSKAGILPKSYAEYGELQPIVYNAKTSTLLDGHRRLETMEPEAEVDVWVVWLDEEQEKGALIALNNSFGEWIEDGVAAVLQKTDDHELTGFNAREASKYLIEMDEEELTSEIVLPQIEKYVLQFSTLENKIAWKSWQEHAQGMDDLIGDMKQWLK